MTPDSASDLPSREAFLAVARVEFAAYYRIASVRDAMLMDNLVMARVALLIALNMNRDRLPQEIRDRIERTTNATEQLYTKLRETVRATPAFQSLPVADRQPILAGVFAVCSPVSP